MDFIRNNTKLVAIAGIIVVAIIAATAFFGFMGAASDQAGYKGRIHQLLSDDKEIERKWVISPDDIPYDLSKAEEKVEIEQFYISFSPEIRVRCYDNGSSYEMTVKDNTSEDGMVRDEANFDIDEGQYESLVLKKEGNTIRKTRYQLYDAGQVVAIDIFHGSLSGLAYMEIEFADEKEAAAYQSPSWVISEVTDDERYKNGGLARDGIPQDDEDDAEGDGDEWNWDDGSEEE